MTHLAATNLSLILIGLFFSLAFSGYLYLSLVEHPNRPIASRWRKLAGLLSIVFGVLLSIFWAYFMINGWENFLENAAQFIGHVLAELLVAVMLVIAGVAMLHNWSRGPALFMIANGLVLLTTVFALLSYGTQGHPLLMNGVAILLIVGFVYMVGFVFAWEHFVLRLDTRRDSDADHTTERV